MFNLSSIPKQVRAAISDEAFRVFAKSGDAFNETGDAELLIMDDIGENWLGEGITARDVALFLDDNRGRDVNVRINSGGGAVYDGLGILNALSEHDGTVTATVEGLAFSAATIVTLGADHVRMHEASDFGIHRSWAVAMGNANTLDGVSEWLRQIDGHLIDLYQAKTGQERAQIEKWLDGTDDGTVFSAKEAFDYGFADEVVPLKSKSKRKAASATAVAAKAMARRVKAGHQAMEAKIRAIRQRVK